jgi:hypothetical protein
MTRTLLTCRRLSGTGNIGLGGNTGTEKTAWAVHFQYIIELCVKKP